MTSKTTFSLDNAEQEHLEYYETNRERHKDERDSIQKKTFTKWVNKHLRKASRNVEDLFVDLRDGHNLISLLEVLSAENLLRENGSTRFHRIQNVQYCLDWLKMKNIRLVNIRPDEIVEGNGKLTLGLIWTIILNFQVSVIKQRQRADAVAAAAVRAAATGGSGAAGGGAGTASPLNASMNTTLEALEGRSAKEALLAWNQRATEGYARVRVANFTTSWRDGLAFSAILHRHRPSAIDWEQISASSMTNRERLAHVFEVAKREFDVDKLLDPEDVDMEAPDEKSIITYVSTLYQNLPCLPEGTVATQSHSEATVVIEEARRWLSWTEGVLRRVEVVEGGRLEEGRAEEAEGVEKGEGDGEGEVEEWKAISEEIEKSRPAIEAFLLLRSAEKGERKEGRGMDGTRDLRAVLELKWDRVKVLCSSHQLKLEVAAREEKAKGELASFTCWLEGAELSLAEAAPVSRLPEGLEAQRREQEERMEEIEQRRAAFLDTVAVARGQIRDDDVNIESDGVAVDSQTVTLECRLSRLQLGAQERSEQLAAAAAETAAWSGAVTSLEVWMDEIESQTATSRCVTMDVGRLRFALEEAKNTVHAISARRVQFELARKRATALMESAPKSERRELERKQEEMRRRWEDLSAAADSRCAAAETAIAEGSTFTEVLVTLEQWLDGELADGAARKEKGCRGDVDTIAGLLSAEKEQEDTRKRRAESIGALRMKVDSLMAEGVEVSTVLSEAVGRLEAKWRAVEEGGRERRAELERGMEEARDCDAKVCSLLVWLAKLEEQLEVPPSSDLATGLAAVGSVRAALSVERPRLASVSETCDGILDGCHPEAEEGLREWRRVIEARWEEVEGRAEAKEQSMIEEEERQRASEQQAAASQETAAWLHEVESLEEWMDGVESKVVAALPKTLAVDRLRREVEEAKSTAADVSARLGHLESMRERGVNLMERASESERKKMERRGEEMKMRWEFVSATADSRCAAAETALTEGAACTASLATLEQWLDGQMAEAAVRAQEGCRGDVDTVAELLAAERRLDEERGRRAEAIVAIRMKVDSLVSEGVEEALALTAAVGRLEEKWMEMEDGGARRRERLEAAMGEARECDAKVYALLEWLVDLEDQLEAPSPADLAAGLAAAAAVRAALGAEQPRLEAVKEACEAILADCHRDAQPALREWRRVVEARWKEVDDQAVAKQESIAAEEEKQRANEAAMDAMREFEERERLELDESRWEAESVGEAIEQCADEVLASLDTRRGLPGVPETAQEQMDEFQAIRSEIDETGGAVEEYLGRTIEAASADEENFIVRNRARLEAKWNRIKDLATARQLTLEAATQRAEQLDAELVDLRGWLQWAEQSLVDAGPISRLPVGLDRQKREQEERMEEIEMRRASFAETKSLARQIRGVCEAKDVVYIKNQTVTLEARLAKMVGRAQERSKQLEAASEETGAWLEGVSALDDWIEEVKSKTDVAPPTTSDVDRLKGALEQAKATVAAVASRRAHFEHTRRAGVALMEHAPKGERREIQEEMGELRRRWDAVCAAADSRCAEAEKALLEGGAFTEALANLEEWLDGELAEGAERREKGCRGDVDTVTELVYAERKREEARGKKAQTIGAITEKADALVSDGVEEATTLSSAAGRLEQKWRAVEDEARERNGELERAMGEAREADAKVRGLLEWLAEMEGRLEVPPSSDLATGLAAAAAVRAALGGERQRLEAAQEACTALLEGCHPDAEPALKEWRRVLEARWKEVEEAAATSEQSMIEEEERQRAREAAMHEMNEFMERKRLELDEASLLSSPTTVQEAEARAVVHALFEEELKERQADVDALTKGRRKDGERDRSADALAESWRALWADSIGRAAQLEQERALLEELKRLEGWKFEEWRDRYVEWNDHGKARVNDLFRRLDRSSTGSVPREAFVEAVLATKFPTSRLEMAKVAGRFDRGDGQINAKEFIASLKIGSKVFTPKSPEEQKRMIRSEMTRRREQCCCAHKFRIEQEEDTPGKPPLKSDGGVLQTYRFGDQQIRRMVRILHTTVMVRVGGGWEPLDEFLGKHDPCKAKDRTNTALHARFYDDVRPAHATDKICDFTKLQHARGDYYGSPSSTVTSPLARSSPKEVLTVLKPHAQVGTPGVVKGVREKTERSVPMFGENRYSRERVASMELLDSSSRPSSRAASELSETPTPSRIPRRKGPSSTTTTPAGRRLADVTNRSPYPLSPPTVVPRKE